VKEVVPRSSAFPPASLKMNSEFVTVSVHPVLLTCTAVRRIRVKRHDVNDVIKFVMSIGSRQSVKFVSQHCNIHPSWPVRMTEPKPLNEQSEM
jgi:hypothetical protein